MNYTTNDNWHYKANKGFFFKKDDVITVDIYLGKFDSIENWTVITEEEKVQFEEEKQRELEELKEKTVEE